MFDFTLNFWKPLRFETYVVLDLAFHYVDILRKEMAVYLLDKLVVTHSFAKYVKLYKHPCVSVVVYLI
jgi:hypothetical protein